VLAHVGVELGLVALGAKPLFVLEDALKIDVGFVENEESRDDE